MKTLILLLTVILSYGHPVYGHDADRCSYMTNIPRLPRPDLTPIDYNGTTWTTRPFIPVLIPDREDVCMDRYIPGSDTTGTQIIFMDEEILEEVAIARLNYDGDAEPEIVRPLLSGSFGLLGPLLRKVNGEWLLFITQKQDYEIDTMRSYMLEIELPGDMFIPVVSLRIVNIDDNAPIIHVLDTCQVPEFSDTGHTTCVYEVSDEDGEISTSAMTFEIDSDRNDDEVFYMEGGNISADWKRMTMTIGLNTHLDYELNALHIFRVTALDSLPNTHTVTIMVQVENVERRVPRWVEIFAVQQLDEKTARNYTVRAIDGDTGINRPIYYKIETEEKDAEFFDIETIEGGHRGAILIVKYINRDYLQRELFPLTITAYKSNNESLATTANVVIIINDINDNAPEPFQDEYTIEIMEETAQTLNFDEEFGFHDIDLGQNAQYTVRLESDHPPGAADAFFIAPEVGYQRQAFIMGTKNHSMLDFEVPEFQNIVLKVIATDNDNASFVGIAYVYVNLINWNDEKPIFEQSTLEVSFNETEGEGFFVGTVRAHDRDIDDRVVHSLLGNARNYLWINETSGGIYVSTDDAFDYHRQNELFIQVRADDTLGEPYNTDTSQLIIRLKDINNTPPTLRLPRRSPQVKENVPENYVITDEIEATDPDTTAELHFEIIWETSYATKQGRDTDTREYHDCVRIETIYPNNNTRSALGRVVVQEIRTNVTIDYEEFEMLYLTIRVVDKNTEIGDDYDELTFAIIIVDLNDNPPVWANGTLSQSFSVRENSRSDHVIGSVLATDIDGPLYNQVRYTIRTREDTPDNLVKIDLQTGQLTVDLDGAIDADTPPRFYLYYTIIASDRCLTEECPPDDTYHDTEGEISIYIVDTNNKTPFPEIEKFNATVYIYENATSGDEVVNIVSDDLDRDEIYNTVSHLINYAVNARLRNFFSVDRISGLVYVNYTTDEVLDRDGNEPVHHIFFTLLDNFFFEGNGNSNQASTQVTVVLLDVNDNAPELPDPSALSWSISEGLEKGVIISPDIYAPDRDEPDTDNSRVGYQITNLTCINRDIEHPMLFDMIQVANVTGELITAEDLKGYWGTYAIGIRAFDHGIPQMDSNNTYSLVINPFNFHDPVFVFPKSDSVLRLATERAVVNGLLVTVNGEFLNRLSATDEDGLEAGTVSFNIVEDDDALQYFQVVNEGDNQGILMLKQLFTQSIREFQVTIRATDAGITPGTRHTDISVKIAFVPTQGDPVFTNNNVDVSFIEREAGLSEQQKLDPAVDPKNHLCVDDCLDIYYRILDGNDAGYFNLDARSNILTLSRELDRNVATSHTLRVAASNTETATTPLSSSILTVTINVREANPQPYFDRQLYTAGISTLDSINRVLLTVSATHTENAVITYTIDMSSMVADPSLWNVLEYAFVLSPQTGILTLNIQPTASMHGMFEFDVIATDPAGAFDTAQVKIYLVSSQNRVFFMFMNKLEQIEQQKSFISTTFTSGFNMTCNIDQVVPATDANGIASGDITEVRAHFISDNVPVETEAIERLRSDTQLLRSIQMIFSTELLVLQDLVTGDSPTINTDSTIVTVYVLGGLAAVLAFMCLVLLVTFFLRTRALNRQLQALSVTKYGSQESGLNRAGLAAPGTNKHAAEGSNPIWNETIKAPDFDAISEGSDDSDLIGIEDLPQFRTDYFPPADANSEQDIFDTPRRQSVATHNNNFGLNATPFSSDFVNNNFMRR